MDLRQLTPNLAVSPQIGIDDVPLLAESGFKTLINNRPNDEAGAVDNEAMAKAAADAGMDYHYLPFQPGQVTPDLIQGFASALDGAKPAIAYCRSGNRSTVLWALSQSGKQSETELLNTAAEAGFDLTGVVPLMRSLAGQRS
ncbi:TIGR01244 family phosphatase [Paracoccus sediminis]|uniref:TIGR01244 family phosphatase n=1 Tax=Paracoccus sediminis TaxID=1214787 RepID=A0A238WSQ1_9RHOB|nr:TIGR01244 family sulfur transferase [Paracoccus sediminis]TBN49954.1 TIGR01244 family phosphatase [Paracoccus sediminis]SNR49586.1 TIGR01244 family protein [Paracoccus sediminis]